jgi:hypothetical protein
VAVLVLAVLTLLAIMQQQTPAVVVAAEVTPEAVVRVVREW